MILEASAAFSVLPQDLNLASMEQFYKVFGPNSITNEQQTDKRAAPGPQEYLWHTSFTELQYFVKTIVLTNQKRVFIPYIFKRGYEPADDVFEPMEYDDMKRLAGNIHLFEQHIIYYILYIYIISVKNWNCHILDSDSTIGSI